MAEPNGSNDGMMGAMYRYVIRGPEKWEEARGAPARLALVVDIEQTFFHCAIVKSVQETPESREALERYYGSEYAYRLY
jgi:hypothetical protein